MSPLFGGDPTPATASAPEVTKFCVTKKAPDDLDVQIYSDCGVNVGVILTEPERQILTVDEEASTLISATDDKGTDLTHSDQGKRDWIDSFTSKISEDRHRIAIPLKFETPPVANASSIQIKAKVVLVCVDGEKTSTLKPVVITKPQTLKFEGRSMEITPGGDRGDKTTQTLLVKVNDRAYWVKTLELIDGKGNVIKSESNSSSREGEMVTKNVALDPAVTSAGFRITYYEKVERVTQAMDLKFGLGLK